MTAVMRSHEDSLKRLKTTASTSSSFTTSTRLSMVAGSSDKRVRELFDRGGFRALEELRSPAR